MIWYCIIASDFDLLVSLFFTTHPKSSGMKNFKIQSSQIKVGTMNTKNRLCTHGVIDTKIIENKKQMIESTTNYVFGIISKIKIGKNIDFWLNRLIKQQNLKIILFVHVINSHLIEQINETTNENKRNTKSNGKLGKCLKFYYNTQWFVRDKLGQSCYL